MERIDPDNLDLSALARQVDEQIERAQGAKDKHLLEWTRIAPNVTKALIERCSKLGTEIAELNDALAEAHAAMAEALGEE